METVNHVCHFHPPNKLSLFCCKCEDVICLQCMLEHHQMHEMKALHEAKGIIREQINKYLKNKEEVEGTIAKNKELILQELADFEAEERNLCSEIEDHRDICMTKVEKTAENLIGVAKEKCKLYRESLRTITKEIVEIETRISETDDEDADWTTNVKLLADIKWSTGALHSMKSEKDLLKPRFVPYLDLSSSLSIGFIETVKYEAAQCQKETIQGPNVYVSVSTQTYSLDEKSLDKIQHEYPMTVQLPTEKLPSKVVPYSDENAWVIIDRKLYELKSSVLLESRYADRVDDIAVLQDSSVLILRRESGYIKRLVKKRLINFVHTSNLVPQCIHTMCDNTVIVFLHLYTGKTMYREFTLLDDTGLVKFMFQLNIDADCVPFVMSSTEVENVYILFHDTDNSYNPPRSRIFKVNLTTKKRTDVEFRGALGIYPYEEFNCHGLCRADENKILVSDQNHHSVLLVDENLKYVKRVVTAFEGLESPTAIAIHNKILWVVDASKIHKIKYI